MRAVAEVTSVRIQNGDKRAGDYKEKVADEGTHARAAGACVKNRRPPTKSGSSGRRTLPALVRSSRMRVGSRPVVSSSQAL